MAEWRPGSPTDRVEVEIENSVLLGAQILFLREPAHLRVPCGLPVKLKYPTPAENDDNKSEKENAESIMLVLSMHPRVVEKAKDARAPLPTINPKHALTRTDSSAEMAVAMVYVSPPPAYGQSLTSTLHRAAHLSSAQCAVWLPTRLLFASSKSNYNSNANSELELQREPGGQLPIYNREYKCQLRVEFEFELELGRRTRCSIHIPVSP
ncbi:hypothetical protein C8R43DRAFT_1111205, partial [Mycena crocata]